jgi:hypothetical protein
LAALVLALAPLLAVWQSTHPQQLEEQEQTCLSCSRMAALPAAAGSWCLSTHHLAPRRHLAAQAAWCGPQQASSQAA